MVLGHQKLLRKILRVPLSESNLQNCFERANEPNLGSVGTIEVCIENTVSKQRHVHLLYKNK